MMPLAMANLGDISIIKKINGNDEIKRFLENLGFVTGGEVIVVSKLSGDMIVSVKNSRIAINKQIANKIMI